MRGRGPQVASVRATAKRMVTRYRKRGAAGLSREADGATVEPATAVLVAERALAASECADCSLTPAAEPFTARHGMEITPDAALMVDRTRDAAGRDGRPLGVHQRRPCTLSDTPCPAATSRVMRSTTSGPGSGA